MKHPRTLQSSEDGATLVEFALIAPVFFMLLMGIFDIGHGVYIRAVLEGALQEAGRDAGLENAPDNLTEIDDYVRSQVGSVVNGEFEFTRQNYWEFGDVGQEEEYDDTNKNGVYDDDECFYDGNDNDRWDDRGKAGLGGAKDVVLYTVTVTYNHLFPLWSFIGGNKEGSVTASTTLRNQPFGSQALRTIEHICP